MARYIDADAFKEILKRSVNHPHNKNAMTSWANAFEEFIDLLDNQPTEDVAEVVRCEDCQHWENYNDVMICGLTKGMKGASGFCDYGVKGVLLKDAEIY